MHCTHTLADVPSVLPLACCRSQEHSKVLKWLMTVLIQAHLSMCWEWVMMIAGIHLLSKGVNNLFCLCTLHTRMLCIGIGGEQMFKVTMNWCGHMLMCQSVRMSQRPDIQQHSHQSVPIWAGHAPLVHIPASQ